MPFALTEAMLLQLGIQDKIVSGATGTGVAASQRFITPVIGDLVLSLIPKRTGAFTSLTVVLEVSGDGGTSWEQASAALNILTQPTVQRIAVAGNLLCRLNITAFVGGTSVDIFAVLSTQAG